MTFDECQRIGLDATVAQIHMQSIGERNWRIFIDRKFWVYYRVRTWTRTGTVALLLEDKALVVAVATTATIGAQHTGERIPEGGFSVTAFTVSNDQALDTDLPDSGKTSDLLNIIDELVVTAEEGLQSVLPDIHTIIGRVNRGLLGNEIRRSVLMSGRKANTKVVSC